MKRLSLYLIVIVALFCLGFIKTQKKLLLIFSYHPDYTWVEEETRGAEGILENKDIACEKFYMDTKRKTSLEWKKEAAALAKKRIEASKPDLVIVFDDNACKFVLKDYLGEKIPFVFCGMNADPQEYGLPAENITGVIEREHLEKSIALLQKIAPDVKKIAIMSDLSPTSQWPISRIKSLRLPVEVFEIYTTNDFNEWKEKVKALQTQVDAIGLFGYHTLSKKGSKESLSPEDVLIWTLKSSSLPEFAINEFTVKDGALCGVSVSGIEQGKAAAKTAIKILDGARPSDIPILSPEAGIPIVNVTRARELNIKIPLNVLKSAYLVK